jgi:putative oxidoreductase
MVKNFMAAVGRMCLSLIFILSAFGKMLDWQGSMGYFTKSLNDMIAHMTNMGWAQDAFNMMLSHANIFLAAAVLLELVGGLLVFFSLKVRLGAFLLILFMIPMTLIMHPFWFLEGMDRQMHMIMFSKNISILGGLIVVCALGRGSSGQSKPASNPSKK